MDANRFDGLTKVLGSGTSRRRLVKRAASSALAGMLGVGGGGAVGATHKGGHRCTPSKNHPCDDLGGGVHPDLELGESACGVGTVCNLEHSCFDDNNCVCMRRVDGSIICTAQHFIDQPCVSDLQCTRRGYTGFHCVLSACLNPTQQRFATACAEPCIKAT